jgi:hypothetical protein
VIDHAHYEELAALAAGGHLSAREYEDLRSHVELCEACEHLVTDLSDIVRAGLPLTRSGISEFADQIKTHPDAAVGERFLERAKLEGITFSRSIEVRVAPPRKRRALLPVAVSVAATAAARTEVPKRGRNCGQKRNNR